MDPFPEGAVSHRMVDGLGSGSQRSARDSTARTGPLGGRPSEAVAAAGTERRRGLGPLVAAKSRCHFRQAPALPGKWKCGSGYPLSEGIRLPRQSLGVAFIL